MTENKQLLGHGPWVEKRRTHLTLSTFEHWWKWLFHIK